ncbi:ATP-dependent DNA helicase [Trichonephila clavipes]|nr:ATP-dependent DNA helicase [Trichonephila clavipes]
MDSRDKVHTFRAGRNASSNEGAWRVLGLPLHAKHPAVTHFAVHLPNDGWPGVKTRDALRPIYTMHVTVCE